MARVVYGVSGEGSGHSSRAREMLSHLVRAGHEVRVVSYDRGFRNLRGDFEVFETIGLRIATADNRVRPLRTLVENLARLPDGLRRLRALRAGLFRGFRPHAVITDFEPMTAYLAAHQGLPLITLDNQHRMRSMSYPCPAHLRKDGIVAEAVVRAMVPRPDVSLVTTFFFGETRNDRTFLFPPILRREVLETRPSAGNHVLVYFTKGFDAMLRVLGRFAGERFRVYGTEREGEDGPLTFRPFGHRGFLEDLAACRAVIATAGFTLMTEALHLRKPMLALPMAGQFEQELNALLLEELGYGARCRGADAVAVATFLRSLPAYRERLASYRGGDNREIEAKLDELLADEAARAVAYHRRSRPEAEAAGARGEDVPV